MKTLLVFICISISILFCQSADFRYHIYDDSEIYNSAVNISRSSSLWLSDQLSIGKNDSQRLIVKFGYSIYPKEINNMTWRLPDFILGIRASNNLLLSGRFYGFHLDKDAPQIIGSGLQYVFGQNDLWMVSFQKTAINGLNDLRLVSSTFNIERCFEKINFDIFLGIGSNTYINRSYFSSLNLPDKIDGNIKYISSKILFPYKKLNLGFASKLSSDLLLFQIFVTKGFL
tara:strand:- start:1204 stop:1890 length:687 start_codon:yes stop_codon:yes gene_type:complete